MRDGKLKARPRTQAQVAVSSDPSHWFLLTPPPISASKSFATPELSALPWTPVSRILLTSADVDWRDGLLHLREFPAANIYSTLAVAAHPHRRKQPLPGLARSNPPVKWETLPLDRLIPLLPPTSLGQKMALFCKAVPLLGGFRIR